MDGYIDSIDIVSIISSQLKIKTRLIAIHKEINLMPKVPEGSEEWVTSIPDINDTKSRFSIKDFNKMKKLRKEIKILCDQEEINKSDMKVYDLNILIKKIKDVPNS